MVFLGERHRQVHRPGLLRVREGHGREVRIRLLLPGHDVRRVEAGRLEHLRHRGAAHSVQRGVDHREVARPVAGQPGDGVEVAVDDVLRQDLARVRARHVGQGADRGDLLGDLGVGGRHDLAAVAEVDLVAVVLRRVVAGGDHHAGDAAELADRERQERCRQGPGEDQGAEAGAGHHLRGVAREHLGVVAGVVADHDRRSPGCAVLDEVRREAGGGAGHDDAVHPVGSGPERAAQPGRPELERAGEPVGEVGGVSAALDVRHDRLELGTGHVVGVLGCPGPGPVEERGHVRCRHEDTVVVAAGETGGAVIRPSGAGRERRSPAPAVVR